MNQAVINIKTEQKIKHEAQKVAADLGLSLSGLINAYLRQLARTKEVYFSLRNEQPSEYLIEAIRESEKERAEGKMKKFKDAKSFLRELKK